MFKWLAPFLLLCSLASACFAGSPYTGAVAPPPSGFTTVAPTAPFCEGRLCSPSGSRLVYVSNSTGNDANACTLASPCKTYKFGWQQLRSGYPDQLLFNCNDTWPATDGRGNSPRGTFGGAGATGSIGGTLTGPILFGSYGSCSGRRPLILMDSTNPGFAFGGGTSHNYIAIIGLEFYYPTRDPTNALYTYAQAQSGSGSVAISQIGGANTAWFLIEDNKFSYFGAAVEMDTSTSKPSHNVTFRRNIVNHTYSLGNGLNFGGHSQGVYFSHLTSPGLVLDSNYIGFAGWDPTLSAAQTVSINTGTGVITWPIASYAFNVLPFGKNSTVEFQTTSGGVSAHTKYCVVNANADAGTFQVTASASGGVCTGSPIVISTASNVMMWDDPTQNIFNHDLYGDESNLGGMTITNNFTAWGNGLMDRSGGTVTGNFSTYSQNSINYGAFVGCCGYPGGEPAITSLNSSGNVVVHARTFIGAGVFADPGDVAGFAYTVNNASGSSVVQKNNIAAQMGTQIGANTSVCQSYANGGPGGSVVNTINTDNICYQVTVGYDLTNGESGSGNVITPQYCTDLAGANSGCAAEPFPAPLNDALTYDQATFGTTCTGGSTFTNTCWIDLHNREVGRAQKNWPDNLAAPALIAHIKAGFGNPF